MHKDVQITDFTTLKCYTIIGKRFNPQLHRDGNGNFWDDSTKTGISRISDQLLSTGSIFTKFTGLVEFGYPDLSAIRFAIAQGKLLW